MRSRDRDQNAAQLQAARNRVQELEAKIGRLAARDLLVASLLTLSAFRAQLELDVQRAHRRGQPLSLAVIDLDDFRRLNLKHGYATGDLVLAAVGELLAGNTRTHDLACRSGADEFILMLPQTPTAEAAAAVKRFLVELEALDVAGQRGVRASIGLAALRPTQSADALLGEATVALNGARAEGGARISISDPGEQSDRATPAEGSRCEVVAALAQALEERDQYTGEHSESVVDLTTRVGDALALDAEAIQNLRTAALLHDIGKVGIPDEILHKPGPLDEDDWQIMRQHPAIGERILRAIPGMGAIARIIRHEHERWDGNGYPDKLAGEEIPIAARIILACDAYHAMVSDRPYRKAMSHHAAMTELTSNAGTQFDPKVVEALVGYLYGRRQSGLAAV